MKYSDGNTFYLSKIARFVGAKTICLLFPIYSLMDCNNAQALNIDASSSVIGALLSDGSSGLFGGTTSPFVKVSVSGYQNLAGKPMNLTLTDSTGVVSDQSLQITADGSYTFGTALNPASGYTVSLGTYTGGQNCSLTGGTGTIGTSASPKIDCERNLAIAATWFAGSIPVARLFQINQITQTQVGSSIFLSQSASVPAIDMVWNGTNYFVVWNGSPGTSAVKGRLFDMEFTPLTAEFPIASGTIIKSVAVTYNSTLNEYAVVFSDNGSVSTAMNSVKYIRVQPDGTLIGSPIVITQVIGSVGTLFGYADIVWDGSKYLTAFEDHDNNTDDAPNNYVDLYSFTNGTPSIVTKLSLFSGTGSTGAIFPVGTTGAAYPNFLRTATDTWLFYNRSNVDSLDKTVDASLMEWRNSGSSGTQIIKDTIPGGCNPNTGYQLYVPSATNFGNKILVGYDLRCATSSINNYNVYHAPISPSTGAATSHINYSGPILPANFTMGASTACRKSRCYTSAGAVSDGLYLFDPGIDGSTDTFLKFMSASPGNGPDFPIQTVTQ
ncbi:hypothetical protein EHQ53_01420 [Leptospira langatensis]|uniref:Uncharacterized protein n=1 Tax=Leptospira langatensis TaxID=2484983 RepID=A0A5F1ZZ34_9LEPT|nr:hypothetical protein [Leptospira langatensis]TGJ98408.1 hypothetical protein EHO57_17560 [Leptospira langatensis]TGL43323.1 hypothetical protein EHQ53_01420 [Leptospira langatensis]